MVSHGDPGEKAEIMLDELRPVRVERSDPPSSEVAKALLEYILSGRIGRGEKLPSERQLSEAFGVGRSVVREGIKSLSLLGLIEFRHGSGTYLRGPDSELFPRVIKWGLLIGEQHTTDLIEARQRLEVITAELAAERRSERQLGELERIFSDLTSADSVDDYVARDVEFHLAIASASGNSALSNMLSSISSLLFVWIESVIEAEHERTFAENSSAKWPTERAISEHRAILAAIRSQDVEAARDAMSFHMRAGGRRLSEVLEQHNRKLPERGAGDQASP